MKSFSTEELYEIIDQSPGVVAYVNADTLQYEFVNKAFETSFGIPRNKIIGSAIKDIIGETNYQFALPFIAKVKTGVSVSYENTFNLSSGKRWVQVNYSPMFDAAGRVEKISVLSNDITDRKRAEAELNQKAYDLDERNKELTCLYEFSKLIDTQNISLDRIFEGLIDLIPPASQYPDITFAKLEIGGQAFTTINFKETPWQLSADILVHGVKQGFLSVGYLIEKPNAEEGLFLKEERQLVNALCERLGRIIERKQAEHRYQLFRDRLNFAIEAAHMGAWELDLIDHTAWRSFRHDEIFGYKSLLQNWTFDMFIDHVIPEDRESVKEKFLNAIATKTDWNFECRIKSVEGIIRWIWAKGSPKYDMNNNPSKMFGIVQDITDRKKAEEALRESERHLRSSQRIAHLGSWRLDVATNQVIWTEELYNMYGFDPALPPPPYIEHMKLFTAGSWERLSTSLDNTRETGIPYELELETAKKDGSNGWMWVRGEAIKDSEDNTIGLWGAAQDISERKRMEGELQKTQKLDSLGLLAGGIAHDFNNLMGGIFGYIDMASEASTENKVTSYLSKAMNTIDRARALTQQLLTFAKGGAPIQEIGQLFPFVEETAKFALSGANVSCHFVVPKDLWACNFDKNQIGQVIDNLIINAQQAMPVGGRIELTARNITLAEKEHPSLSKGNFVKISVKDTGVGIPKELIAKIFDPFFTTKAKGHGLGLATCYSIINRHGGCIDVESEPGKGSTFQVYLPASMESASSVNQKKAKTHKGSGTFLIMDDEEVMRDTIGAMLEALGYSVVSKENGKDAIVFFATESKANRKITGIIFDLTVPGGMGGKAAIEEIRKLNKDIPAFVASGYADDPVMKNPLEYGFMASICKPFRKSELSEMLNKYMKPKK